MDDDETDAIIVETMRGLVGHVVVLRAGEPVAVPVVEAGFVEEARPGEVGDAIEHRRIRGVPAFRVWRAVEAS